MRVYVSHARRTNFEGELYKPLREANFPVEFIFPYENNPQSFNVKQMLEEKQCDLVLAEVSHQATGQGIELAWAEAQGVPIVCIYKQGADISGSLKFLTDKFLQYENEVDMVNKVSIELGFNIA